MKERKKKDIANEFGVLPSTLSNILKNKEVILKNAEDVAVNTKRKRLRPCHFEDIDEAMLKWLLVARGKNLPLSGPLLKQKAKDFAEALGHHEFEASTGWLDKFKSRHGVIQKTLCGESADTNIENRDEWVTNVLPKLIENYNINDIFNADETALFFKCLPTKTLAFKNEKCFGGKQSKERITVLVGSNMTGSEKLKLLVIGKAKNPRYFKGIKSLGVDYEFNKKAWMTSEIFTKWIVKLDKKFCDQNRKVLFFVDNCTAYPKDVRDKLRNIHLAYFPPNMTSLLQPMDQGIIYNMKQHYRKRILTNILTQVDEGNSVMAIDLLQAVRNLSNIWNVYVKPETVANCFKKAGFSKDVMQIPFEHWDEEDLLLISD
ncbi:tigger transposable element-derived protein 4-like [Anastrepha ludens]|uniref:tigger transposable element-derived protein 4-like n=1 Tax=Anastrepha ludens TaxID=28586 RepID=UPI0023AFDEFB|nr:tigger transposable element-derived protein 4-like [Anastrepha ludens]